MELKFLHIFFLMSSCLLKRLRVTSLYLTTVFATLQLGKSEGIRLELPNYVYIRNVNYVITMGSDVRDYLNLSEKRHL